MHRAVNGDFGVAAVGYSGFKAAVWLFDGNAWSPRYDDSFGISGHILEMWGVAAKGNDLVAVGSDCASGQLLPGDPLGSTCDPGQLDAAVWFSDNGGTAWKRVSVRALSRDGDQQMTTVIQGGPGFVAVGYDEVAGDRNAAVWTSTDGRTWLKVEDDDLGGTGVQEIKTVTTIDDNLVAAGFDGSGGDLNGAVWTSIDGRTWTKSTPPALGGLDVQQIKGIVPFGDKLIAVGRDRSASHNEDAAVWVATVTTAG